MKLRTLATVPTSAPPSFLVADPAQKRAPGKRTSTQKTRVGFFGVSRYGRARQVRPQVANTRQVAALRAKKPCRVCASWGLDIARTLTDAGGVGALLQIADHTSGKTFLPAYDGNGNIVALLNASTGALAACYEYSPFGEFLRCESPDPVVADQPFRFSTKFFDGETGLYDYGRRLYSPSQGRFLGRDPIEEKGGLNLYGFCHNNSINTWDVLGNDDYEDWLNDQISQAYGSGNQHRGDSFMNQLSLYLKNRDNGWQDDEYRNWLAQQQSIADDNAFILESQQIFDQNSVLRGNNPTTGSSASTPKLTDKPGVYSTPQAAAAAALLSANPSSIQANTEFAGVIYKVPGGYTYTAPFPGGVSGSNPYAIFVGDSSSVVGGYHTHGDYSTQNGQRTTQANDYFNSNNFSPTDYRQANAAQTYASSGSYVSYLGTPSGSFLQMIPTGNGGGIVLPFFPPKP